MIITITHTPGKGWAWTAQIDGRTLQGMDHACTTTAAIIDAMQKFPPKPGASVRVDVSNKITGGSS